MAFPKEFILKARQANLVSFLQAKGFELKREGKNWRVPGHGGLVVKDNGSCYYHFSTKSSGNALDCCLKILNMSFRDAVLGLNGVSSVDASLPLFEKKEEKKELEMPSRFRNEHRVIAYLTKTRGLPAGMVVELIRAGLLYQDGNGNCVFICRDVAGRARGAILAGTVSNISWKGVAAGSDTSFGWWWPPVGTGTADTLLVVEAPIDAMSLAVINPSVRQWHVLALGGLHREALEGFIGRCKVQKVVLALDGDIWGRKAACEWSEWLLEHCYDVEELVPVAKDWNDVLRQK